MCSLIWRRQSNLAVRCGFDLGVPWQALEMGKDEGLALFQKTRGCLPAV